MFDLVRPRRVLGNRRLGPDAFVLTFERRQDRVKAGRHVAVGLPGAETRAYSLYSGETDPNLEILVREVDRGRVSPRLSLLQPGDEVQVDPPKGNFNLEGVRPGERVLLVATGTGIAPFRSFLRSRPDLDYTLVHGARNGDDDFGADFAPAQHRVFCVSGPRVPEGAFGGRVTGWLADADLSGYAHAFLCGNARMVFEAFPLLADKGLDQDHIHTETYF